jgi:oligopeptide/dipeptide ABC transporter ATP-binding protein
MSAEPLDTTSGPLVETSGPLVETHDLQVHFPVKGYGVVRAVDGVSLRVAPAEIVGLVGESGCGKTTIGRCITGEIAATRGEVLLDGRVIGRRRRPAVRRAIQMVYQDPATSLNPRLSVRQVLAELLHVHHLVPRGQVEGRCRELLSYVGLPPRALDGYPHQFSGGQRQRIAIARALAVEPRMLVADEPVSALDVSVQATILALFAELRERLGLAILLISHNLAVVRHLSDRVAVMYLGRIAEAASRDDLFGDPRAPYTQVLLKSAPRLSQIGRTPEAALKGEPPSVIDVPSGCRFHTRCPRAEAICEADEPRLLPVDGGIDDSANPGTWVHLAACHFRSERAQPQPRKTVTPAPPPGP